MAKKPKSAAPAKIEPGPKTQTAIAKAIQSFQSRPARAYVRWERGSDGAVAPGSPHTDEIGHSAQLMSALGTCSTGFLTRNLGYLEDVTRNRFEDRGQSEAAFNAGLALVQAVDPQNELEAALAIQIAGSHALTMDMLGRTKSTDRTDHIELYGNMAVKLQRTFTAQIEALARLRGKGQQTVRVEHVTVHPGAQAIVGDVHHHSPGVPGGAIGKRESTPWNDNRSHNRSSRRRVAWPGPARERRANPRQCRTADAGSTAGCRQACPATRTRSSTGAGVARRSRFGARCG